MRLFHACPPSCKRLRVDTETAGTAERRLRTLELVDEMNSGGMRRLNALKAIGLSKSTYYDWRRAFRRGGARALKPGSTRPRSVRRRRWTDADDQAVLNLRAERPYMGKAKLKAMLDRRGVHLSVSTVGRIIGKAIADRRIQPASFYEGRTRTRRRRNFDGAWAQRWKHGDRAKAPGEMVQIDHMTFNRNGRTIKEFRAVCPVSRFMVSRVFSRATATNAKRFLQVVLENMPFPIASVQVDGGSEFRADFEGKPARSSPSPCTSCRRKGRSGTGASSEPTGLPASSSGDSTTAPSPSPTSPQNSPSTSSSTTTSARTGRWTAEPPNEYLVGIENNA